METNDKPGNRLVETLELMTEMSDYETEAQRGERHALGVIRSSWIDPQFSSFDYARIEYYLGGETNDYKVAFVRTLKRVLGENFYENFHAALRIKAALDQLKPDDE